jgi:lycopene cyclase domain-containing protein
VTGALTYTQLAVAAVPLTVALDVVVLRSRVLARRSFWAAYAIVLAFQLVTNGVLTGFEIVRYDPGTILGWRLARAPVEDLLFGFALVTSTLSWWVFWGRRGLQREPLAGPPRWRGDRADHR